MKLRPLLPLLALACLPLVPAHANITGFGDGSAFKLNQGQTNANASISGGVATLTSGQLYQGNSVFSTSKQDVSAFNVTFTYQDVGGSATKSTADGFTFTVQNDSRGASAVGYDGNALGYVGGTGNTGTSPAQTARTAIGNSFAVGFNVFGTPSTGLGTNGALTLGNSLSTVLTNTGNPIDVKLSYNGSVLTETLTDTTNRALTSTFSYNVTLATASITDKMAYVGFTGATGATTSTQTISNFTFTTVPEPSTWAAGALTVLAGVAVARRRFMSSK